MGVRWLQLGTRALPGLLGAGAAAAAPGAYAERAERPREEPGTARAPCPGMRGPPHPTAASRPAQAPSTHCLNASNAVSLLARTSNEHLLAHHPSQLAATPQPARWVTLKGWIKPNQVTPASTCTAHQPLVWREHLKRISTAHLLPGCLVQN